MKVAIVGASGRVGAGLCEGLADRFEIVPIGRVIGEAAEALAARAVSGVDALVNAAGVAHLDRETDDDVARLRAANVELPSLLAEACRDAGISMVHISSVKATSDDATAYAVSKRDGDRKLVEEWADEFENRWLQLVIVRPLAMLFPPLDAGKVAKLRFVRRVPPRLVPPIPLPVLSTATFVDAIAHELSLIEGGQARPGVAHRDFDRAERGTLRDVRAAFVADEM